MIFVKLDMLCICHDILFDNCQADSKIRIYWCGPWSLAEGGSEEERSANHMRWSQPFRYHGWVSQWRGACYNGRCSDHAVRPYSDHMISGSNNWEIFLARQIFPQQDNKMILAPSNSYGNRRWGRLTPWKASSKLFYLSLNLLTSV